jgi:hypothetical protein
MPTPITSHEGKKYLRTIYPATGHSTVGGPADPIQIDVYCVIKAFKIICPAQAHALKKVLCAGQRDKGSAKADLEGAIAALNRAIEMLDEGSEDKE